MKAKYVFTALALSASIAATAQTGDEILAKHITAIGGDTWSKVSTLKLTGGMTVQGMTVNMTTTFAQAKGMRMDLSVMGMSGYTIITPTEGWVYMPPQGITKPTPLPADQVKAGQGQLNIPYIFVADKSAFTKVEAKGKEAVDGKDCFKVDVTEKEGTTKTMFFDAANYNLIRVVSTGKVEGEEVSETVNYSNFVKMPEGVTLAMTWGTSQGDIIYTAAEINKPVDAAIFKPGDEKK